MLVNSRSAHYCCKYCFVEYGKSANGPSKRKFSRSIKRRERNRWKREVRNYMK